MNFDDEVNQILMELVNPKFQQNKLTQSKFNPNAQSKAFGTHKGQPTGETERTSAILNAKAEADQAAAVEAEAQQVAMADLDAKMQDEKNKVIAYQQQLKATIDPLWLTLSSTTSFSADCNKCVAV